jgi:hypothetical protein
MSRGTYTLTAILCLLGLPFMCSAQEKCVYRIVASDCIQPPQERYQTGFTLRGIQGIFTALHGVVDARHIAAVSRGANMAFGALQIEKADPERDVALLVSAELRKAEVPGLEISPWQEGSEAGPLTVLGHPYGINLIPTTDLHLRTRELVELRTLLDDDSKKPVRDRGSPSYKAKVLSIQGNLLPGDSGAPILDSSNRVLGLANGGLKGGLSGICWAIPIGTLSWEDNPEDSLARLRLLKPEEVFAFSNGRRKSPQKVGLEEGLKMLYDEVSTGFRKFRGAFSEKIPAREMQPAIDVYQGLLLFGGGDSAWCNKLEYKESTTKYEYEIFFKAMPLTTFQDMEKRISDYMDDFKERVESADRVYWYTKGAHVSLEKKTALGGKYEVWLTIGTSGEYW